MATKHLTSMSIKRQPFGTKMDTARVLWDPITQYRGTSLLKSTRSLKSIKLNFPISMSPSEDRASGRRDRQTASQHQVQRKGRAEIDISGRRKEIEGLWFKLVWCSGVGSKSEKENSSYLEIYLYMI